MSGKDNWSTVAVCLVFALTFGAVGVFASWAIGSTLLDGYAARDWVRVKADVVAYGGGNLSYRYRVGERDYTSSRLSVGFTDPSEVDGELDARLSAALAEKRPITVFVDPANPARSVADISIPWEMVLFLTPFALGFGGVGVGALFVMARVMASGGEKPAAARVASASSGVWGIWVFAFFWNALAIPISLLAVPDMVRSGEWVGLLILIFPLVGLFLVWAAIKGTLEHMRRGGATMHLQHAAPRLGSFVTGHVAARRMEPGETFRVKLACVTGYETGAPLTHWSKEASARVVEGPQGARVAFSFDTPDRLPPAAGERDESTHWRLDLFRPNETDPAYTFGFEMLPPEGAEHESEEEEGALAGDEDQPVPAGIPKGLEGIAGFVGKERIEARLADMSRTERAQLHAQLEGLTAAQKATLAKFGQYAHYGPLVKKLVIGVIVLFVVVQIIGVVVAVVFSN